jgi:ATP-dependent RNA helicase RhlB
MFDMGFYPDLRKLIKVVPPADRRQTMLFSATLNAWVKNLAWEYTKSPFEIEIAPEIVTVDEVEQILYHVPSEDKMRLLLGILQREQPESAIIFCNTKRYTEIAAKRLQINGYEVEFIIGDLPQVKRLKVIEDIKKGKLRYLVATDVAARGLDIEGLALVVNFDLPNEAENYVHRIGRTARAGKTGKAITLASEQDVYQLPAIERYIGKKIPSETVSEELYTEDESEGARIRTEFSGDDFGARGRGSGKSLPPRAKNRSGHKTKGTTEFPRREQGKAPEERALQKRRPEKTSNFSSHHRKDGVAGGVTHEGKKRKPRVDLAAKEANREDLRLQDAHPLGVPLTQLSFEERMAYYKKKYNREAEPGVSGNESAGKSASAEPRKNRNQKNNKNRGPAGQNDTLAKSPKKAASQPIEPSESEPKLNGKTQSAPASQSTDASQSAPPPPERNEGSKGIFSRLLGILRPKDSKKSSSESKDT